MKTIGMFLLCATLGHASLPPAQFMPLANQGAHDGTQQIIRYIRGQYPHCHASDPQLEHEINDLRTKADLDYQALAQRAHLAQEPRAPNADIAAMRQEQWSNKLSYFNNASAWQTGHEQRVNCCTKIAGGSLTAFNLLIGGGLIATTWYLTCAGGK